MINNISYTVANKLCTGCGICEDVCPTGSIKVRAENGEWRPSLNKVTCLGNKCGRCLKVCPGVGCELDKLAERFFKNKNVKYDKYIGSYCSLHTGYSLDERIRLHSASGGVVSQFLIYLLDKKIIDGAVVTAFSDIDHLTPTSYIARSKDDIIKARSSKYCPVSLNVVGNEMVKMDGRYIIVGLPCHIQGFRKRAEIDRKFRERVVGYFSIYCSSNRTFGAQQYLLRKYQVDRDDVSYFAYRDNGCLGDLIIESSENRTEIPYAKYYGALRSFFKPHRCLTCIDHYGQLADVSFGDIHIKPYSDDTIGLSSWIIRNPWFESLFNDAEKDGYIKMEEVDARILNESQKAMLYPKERRASALPNIDKLLGRHVVSYGRRLSSPRLKDYLAEVVCHCQRFIGRHRRLWWIIDLFYDRRVGKL